MPRDDWHWLKTRTPHSCDGCGRVIPEGSEVVEWDVWLDNLRERIWLCGRCLGIVECDARRPLDIRRDIHTYFCREICEHCDDYPLCERAEHLQTSEVGSVIYGE